MATKGLRVEFHSGSKDEQPDSHGTAEFVGRCRQRSHSKLLETNGNFTHGLCRVAVNFYLPFSPLSGEGERSTKCPDQLRNGLNCTGVVVGQHQRDELRVGSDIFKDGLNVGNAIPGNWEPVDTMTGMS